MIKDDPPAALAKLDVGTTAQWRAAGLSERQIRSLAQAGLLVRRRRGVYATSDLLTAVEENPGRAHALEVASVTTTTHRRAVASHRSAALMHGLDLLDDRAGQPLVTLTLPPGTRGGRLRGENIVFYTGKLPPEHVTHRYGVRVTTMARTVVDLARLSSFRAAVTVADSALHTAGTSKPELRRVAGACARWPGIAQARRVIAFADKRAESPLESCARVLFDECGLEPPELQVTFRGDGFVFRGDFYFRTYKTIVEADGLGKYAGKEDVLAQLRRDRLLRDAGYKIVHFTWRELFETPDLVIARIRKAFASGTPY